MNAEEHRQRHIQLHAALDELVACYCQQTKFYPSKVFVYDLLHWSYLQTKAPTLGYEHPPPNPNYQLDLPVDQVKT